MQQENKQPKDSATDDDLRQRREHQIRRATGKLANRRATYEDLLFLVPKMPGLRVSRDEITRSLKSWI